MREGRAACVAGGRGRPAITGPGGSWQPDVPVPALPQVVLLEPHLHGVPLRAGDHHGGLARGQHMIGEDHHAVIAGVHHAHRGHLAEVLVPGGRLSLDRGDDVAGGHLGHRLGGEPGLGDPDRHRGLPGRRHLRGDASRVDLWVGLGLVGVLDRDVALVVGQARRGADDVLAREGRHHHGVTERHGTAVPSVSLIRSPVTSSNATPVSTVMPSFFRNMLSSFSPPGRPPMPKWPTNGSLVTKVSGTLLCSLALRSWWEVLNKNSYAAPKQLAPCVAPSTTVPGASRNLRHAWPARSASASVVIVCA